MSKKLKDLKEINGDEFKESPPPKNKTGTLPAMTGPGVEVPKNATLDKFIAKYEKAKEKRCAESPSELAAKKELKYALHQARESLPVNSDGERFYRSADYERDYVLAEKLTVKKHHDDEGDDE